MEKRTQLAVAVGLGILALVVNRWYLGERIRDVSPKHPVGVWVAKSTIKAGTPLTEMQVTLKRVPKGFIPPSALKEDDLESYRGQQIAVDLFPGDYVLNTFFQVEGIAATGNKLSGRIENEQFRAITIPVDETNSLARSVVPGDRIDIQYTVQVPGTPEKVSVLFLQNIPVLATGPFAASDVDGRTGQRRFSSLTLLLPVQDAMRLTFARQVGQVNILLRGSKTAGALADASSIAGVKDVLTGGHRELVDGMVQKQAATQTLTNSDAVKTQLRELLEKQRAQQGR